MSPRAVQELIDPACLDGAVEMFQAIAEMTEAAAAPEIDDDLATKFSWRLAGLTTLADLVGSDAMFFGATPLLTPIDTYWRDASNSARRALGTKGLVPSTPRADLAIKGAAGKRLTYRQPN